MIKDNPNLAECAKQEVERDSLARLARLVAQLDERLNDANTRLETTLLRLGAYGNPQGVSCAGEAPSPSGLVDSCFASAHGISNEIYSLQDRLGRLEEIVG